MKKTFQFHITGTHCSACKIMIEDILADEPGVEKVAVNLMKKEVTIEGNFEEDEKTLAEKWSKILAKNGYQLTVEKPEPAQNHKKFTYAIPLGLLILGLFLLLQRSGILDINLADGVTKWTALSIGIIASLSTCLAIVGGLVLSLSAEISKDVSSVRPFIFFHAGRLGGFAVFGGILGVAGSFIKISTTGSSILGIIVSIVMVILGLNLLDIFHVTKRFQLTLPRGMFDRLTKIEKGFFAPFIIGVGTFFLPCGFTQSMQIAALSSGSFWSGSLIMGMFALGTLPVLALLSFGSFQF
ncbi:MAG: sulfite exporter TauE/SafE family protein, partial [Patescibacteria group bacterium]